MKNIKLEKAKGLSYPDGGGIWKIEGKQMLVRITANERVYNPVARLSKMN